MGMAVGGIVLPVTVNGLEVDALEGKLDGELCGPRFSHHKNDHLKKLITVRKSKKM
jgi:hypothetical protein